jgi:iron complex outermembrane receptor protein
MIRNLLLASVAAAAMTAPALAQTAPAPDDGEDSVAVEEIVVTAQRREERLQDVPLTVTVVGGAQLERQNITNATELSNASPELNFTAGPASGYSIRGSGTSTFTRSAENNVSIVVDGVIQSQLFPPVNSLFDVARVEVLSGPQGLLFGKNASAGVVQIITNDPDPSRREFRLFGSLGTEGYQVVQGVANLPLGDDAALRFTAFSNSQGDLLFNRANGDYFGGFTNSGGRLRGLWDVNDRLRLNVIADYEKQTGGNTVWTVRSAGGAAFAAGLARCGVRPGPENFEVCLDGPTSRVQETYGLSVQADYDLGGGYTLTSITADRQISRAVNTDSDALNLNILNQNKATDFTNQFTQELRIASPTDQPLEFVAGLFYFNYNYKPFVDQAGTLGALPFVVDRASIQKVNQFSYAAFGQASYALTEQFKLIAGARFTRDVLSSSTFNFVIPSSGRRLTPGFTPPEGTINDRTREDNLSYRLGAQYLPNRDTTFFVTYTEGYKGPALNNLAPGLAGPRIVEPETPEELRGGGESRAAGPPAGAGRDRLQHGHGELPGADRPERQRRDQLRLQQRRRAQGHRRPAERLRAGHRRPELHRRRSLQQGGVRRLHRPVQRALPDGMHAHRRGPGHQRQRAATRRRAGAEDRRVVQLRLPPGGAGRRLHPGQRELPVGGEHLRHARSQPGHRGLHAGGRPRRRAQPGRPADPGPVRQEPDRRAPAGHHLPRSPEPGEQLRPGVRLRRRPRRGRLSRRALLAWPRAGSRSPCRLSCQRWWTRQGSNL